MYGIIKQYSARCKGVPERFKQAKCVGVPGDLMIFGVFLKKILNELEIRNNLSNKSVLRGINECSRGFAEAQAIRQLRNSREI